MNCLFFWFCHHFYFTGVRFAILTSWLGPTFTFFKKNCFSVEKVLTKRDGADLSRTSKNDERTDDLTRLKDNITDDPTISSNMNKRTDDIANSWKKNKRTCYGGDVLNEDPFWYLNSMGYPPKIDIPSDDLVLVNNFEDTFGDMYGGGVWSNLVKQLLPTYLEMLSHLLHSMVNLY